MDMHVDGELFYDQLSQKPRYFEGGKAFYYLVNEIDLNEGVIDQIASGIHAVYSLVFELGVTDDPLKITKDQFMAYFTKRKSLPAGLPADEVSQNYHNARKIPEKLAAVGFAIVPVDAKDPADELSQAEF